MECHGFALHKGDFCDAVALRYGWTYRIFLLTVSVVDLTLLNMLSAALMEPFQPYDTTI